MILYRDKTYSFVELFNDKTGTLVRSNILENNVETTQVPQMRSFPELIDIGIMGSCKSGRTGMCSKAGVDCYQCGADSTNPNMSLADYKSIIDQCRGRVFQVALGGAGDPNKHEQFEDILRATRQNGIVPNYTTSGFELTDFEVCLTKKYCGAVAVSYYSSLDIHRKETNMMTIASINRFVGAGCITNIHYVVSKKNIREAIERVRGNMFPEGINAVIFLLYKPVGNALMDYVLDCGDKEYLEFLYLVAHSHCEWKYGFDTCQSPALFKSTKNIAIESIEFCEAARFSMYIDSRCVAFPCSFGLDRDEFAVDLKEYSICEAWSSEQFAKFRTFQDSMCAGCAVERCRRCPLDLVLNSCGNTVQKNMV